MLLRNCYRQRLFQVAPRSHLCASEKRRIMFLPSSTDTTRSNDWIAPMLWYIERTGARSSAGRAMPF